MDHFQVLKDCILDMSPSTRGHLYSLAIKTRREWITIDDESLGKLQECHMDANLPHEKDNEFFSQLLSPNVKFGNVHGVWILI